MRKTLLLVTVVSLMTFGSGSSALAAPNSDRIPPTVTTFNPANNSTNVVISVQPKVTWSEAINSASVAYTFKTVPTSGKAINVNATLTYDSTTKTTTIKPSTPLAYLTKYALTLKAKDVAGNTSVNYTWGFTTQAVPPPPNQAPVAKVAVSPNSGNAPLAVTADASTSTDDNGITGYTFDFGDATVVGPQTAKTATHTYTTPGNYVTKVTVTDAGGLTATAQVNVSVSTPPPPPNDAPIAKVAVTPSSGDTPLVVAIDASASTDNTDTFPIASYTYDFGDGNTEGPTTNPQTTHTYTDIHAYTVTVTVTDTGGLSSTASAQVEVYGPNQPPIAKLSVDPATTNAPVIVTVDGSKSTDDRGSLQYTFDFGDGAVVGPQLDAIADHRYPNEGSYTVKLDVVDNFGLVSSDSTTITVGPKPTSVVNDLSNTSAETAKTTNCPTATTTGSGGVAWTECPTFWFTAAHGGGVNTSTYEWANVGHTSNRSLKINGTGFGSNCYIGAKAVGETRSACGTAAWNYATTPVTAGEHYVYSNWYKSDADTEVDSTVQCADGTFAYYYLGTVSPSPTDWSQVRYEFDVPLTCKSGSPVTRMSVYHLVYQNTTLYIDDVLWGKYAQSPFKRGLVSVTLDDGFTNQVTNGQPILDNYGVKGTFFIISGELSSQPTYMSPAQISALKANGHDVQSHTVTHSNLTKLSSAALDDEVKSSQQTLTNSFGGPIGDIAAPYGANNATTVAAISKYYQSQRTTDTGYNSRDYLDPYRLRVKNIKNTTTPAQVKAWVDEAAAKGLWLILVYHQITDDTSAGTYSTTVADFDRHMSDIHNDTLTTNLGAVTLSQGLHETAKQAGVVLNPVPPVDDELISNNGVETANSTGTGPLNWSKGQWGTNTYGYSWSSDAHNGSKSLRIDITSLTDGQVKWYFPSVGVQGGKRYVFSDWYKSNVTTAVSVAYTMTDGTVHYDGQDFSIPSSPTTWTQYKIGVVLPPGAVSAFFMHNLGKVGWLETDDYSMKLSTVDAGFSRGLISLTFDDASASIYDAIAVTDTYGFKTTQYVPTDGLNHWTWSSAQVRSVDQRGHEIAAHSESHPDLTKVSDSQLRTEVSGSKAILENIIGHPVVSFSEPYGYYDDRVLKAIQDAGYTSARSVDVGYNTSYDVNPWNIHVENMMSTTTMAEYNSWVNEAIAGKYWLVIVYHEVMNGSTGDPGLDRYSTTPVLFKSQMDSVQASGLAVRTVRDAVGEVVPQRVTW